MQTRGGVRTKFLHKSPDAGARGNMIFSETSAGSALRYGSETQEAIPGAIHHVISRGDHREPIFSDDQDRRLFLTAALAGCGHARGGFGATL
jgi:hypothetical protein